MKKLFAILAATALSLGMWSCGPVEPAIEQLPITSANIAGVWELTHWQGAAVEEDMFVCIEFVNSGRTFTLYQNVNSSVVDVVTGTYNLYTNKNGQSILRGIYDYSDSTEWSHRYMVNSLTATTMTLTVYDEGALSNEGAEKFVYKKCDSLPERIGK